MTSYDDQNIFAKILRSEIPCEKIYEDKYVLSFKDVNPQAPSHILIIPKGAYKDINDFSENASNEEIIAFNKHNSLATPFITIKTIISLPFQSRAVWHMIERETKYVL